VVGVQVMSVARRDGRALVPHQRLVHSRTVHVAAQQGA
jgi:hypothetical protein